jgi:GNAT superfamily N-acetyltransferase
MTDILIRRALAADAAELTTCFERAWAPVLARGISLPPVSEGLAGDIASHLVWVAQRAKQQEEPEKEQQKEQQDGRLLGGLVAVADRSHLHIANLAVDPEAQGLGVSRVLLAQAEQYCLLQGWKELRLSTHIEMPENVALYSHLGWRITAQDGLKVLMSKAAKAL